MSGGGNGRANNSNQHGEEDRHRDWLINHNWALFHYLFGLGPDEGTGAGLFLPVPEIGLTSGSVS